MEAINVLCIGALLLAGMIYGIVAIVTRKTNWQGRDYEGKAAVAAGWAITFIFAFLSVALLYGFLSEK